MLMCDIMWSGKYYANRDRAARRKGTLQKMDKQIKLTFWNYIDFNDYKPEMLQDWKDCGMTHPVTPCFDSQKHDCRAFLKMLDDAEKFGLKMILQIYDVFLDRYDRGEDEYRRVCGEIHAKFGSHPAAVGYYVGEEPNSESEKNYFGGVKVLKKVAGDMPVYCNMGSIERTERMMLRGRNLAGWMKDFSSHTGADVIGYGTYSQLLPGGVGIDEHFYNIREFMKGAKETGMEIWASLLSSAHYKYRIPTEYDFQWQINTAVACGCKAVVWFRMYDKLVAPDLWGSPIDEFGERSPRFYDLARVQKRFNIHHGEIMARLHHKESYGVGIAYGGYHYFLPGASELIERAVCPSGMLNFYVDDDGVDYAVIVNTSQTEACTFALGLTEKVKEAGIVRFNGESYSKLCGRDAKDGLISTGEIWLAPGQMEIIKLTRA